MYLTIFPFASFVAVEVILLPFSILLTQLRHLSSSDVGAALIAFITPADK